RPQSRKLFLSHLAKLTGRGKCCRNDCCPGLFLQVFGCSQKCPPIILRMQLLFLPMSRKEDVFDSTLACGLMKMIPDSTCYLVSEATCIDAPSIYELGIVTDKNQD